jgi:hypothetical protein
MLFALVNFQRRGFNAAVGASSARFVVISSCGNLHFFFVASSSLGWTFSLALFLFLLSIATILTPCATSNQPSDGRPATLLKSDHAFLASSEDGRRMKDLSGPNPSCGCLSEALDFCVGTGLWHLRKKAKPSCLQPRVFFR